MLYEIRTKQMWVLFVSLQIVHHIIHSFNECSLKVTIEFTRKESWTADQAVVDFFNTLYARFIQYD